MKAWHIRLSLFWRFQLAGWGLFILVTFPLKLALAGTLVGALALCVIRDGSSFLITLSLRHVYRKFWSNHSGKMAVLITSACAFAGVSQMGFFLLLHTFVSTEGEILAGHPMAFNVFYERTGLLFGWSFLYFGMRYALDGVQKELRLTLLESEKRQAQLQLLRAQMNPHFLFNALNTIRAGVEKANAELGAMVQSLADFLRFSLDHSQADFIPLGREYDAMRDYLAVEKTRFRDKLEFHCEIDETARAVSVPGIILQPLVENAVKYGQDTSELPLRVSVHVSRLNADTLQLTVANSGRWLEPAPREKSSHLGLQNLRNRLALLYPGKHRLDIAHGNGWVTITIQIPIL